MTNTDASDYLAEQTREYAAKIKHLDSIMKEYHIAMGILKGDIDDTIDNIQDEIESVLRDILPHGSGIDCDWEFEYYDNGGIKCKNFYHAMNDNGYYVKYIPISVKFYRHTKTEYRTYANGTKHQLLKKRGMLDYIVYAPTSDYYAYDLRDCLYQTMWYLDILIRGWYLKVTNNH